MNIDFHYYGTYVAAKLAGYDDKQAQTIAHAAQYVDDSEDDMLKDSLGHYYITEFTPVPTVQNMQEMMDKNFHWSEQGLKKTVDIWVPFHFLPGNYGDIANIKIYTGPTSDTGTMFYWQFDEESKKQFKLLCQPNSLLVKKMINDIVINHSDKDYTLLMTGLKMHVLADTWAHMFYIGMPAWFVNDANDDVYKIDGNTKTPVVWQRVWPWNDSSDILNGETATPDMLAYNSIVYLGHGRMGHLPDYPYLKYQYTPRWSNVSITKDNSSYFLQAFKQLTKALTCIKNKTSFDINNYADLPADVENVIKEILATKINDQSETWRNNINRIKVNNVPLTAPEPYDKNLWLDILKKRETPIENTDYYRFNFSAVQHLELVRESLAEYNINIDYTPKEDIVSTKFRCKKAYYIGGIDEQSTSENYPKMADKGIFLEIIKQTPRLLTSGDIIEIKTLEAKAGEYNFLGAWETTALYYYLRDWDISKQKWQIEKVDTSFDTIIRANDQVRFKNINFKDKPYMCTYDYWMGGTYLTTQASGSGNNAIWIMEGFTEFNMFIVTTDYFLSALIDLETSTSIHDDMRTYGIISDNNEVDLRNLKIALANIGLAFITVSLNAGQEQQVFLQLSKLANYES